MGILDKLKESFKAREPFDRVIAPVAHEAVKIYEDCVCYPKDALVRLYQKEAEIRGIKDLEELKARIHEFEEVRREVAATRYAETQRKILRQLFQ